MEFYLKENGICASFDYGELRISGNEEYGFRPYQLMAASIAGCSASVFRKIIEKQHLELTDWKVAAEVERNPQEANRIEKIVLRYIIKGHNVDKIKLQKNLKIARNNCSMIRSVEDSIDIEEVLEFEED